MNRKEFLKKFGFGSLATIGGIPISERILQSNEIIENDESQRTPKRKREAAICLTYGDLRDSYDFPLRPRGLVSDGTAILFVWPSERGQARGYVKSFDEVKTPIDEIVFRLRMGRPESPYYLRWRRGDYYLYTPPGALIHRAVACIKKADMCDMENEIEMYYSNTLQALSDVRFAIILNLTQWGDGQKILDEVADLDYKVQSAGLNISPYWREYMNLLTESKGGEI